MMMMTRPTDGFDDDELTHFAMEIINDLTSDPTIHPPIGAEDPFICELAEEIEKEMMNYYVHNSKYSNPSSYTDPSLYLQSHNPSTSTMATNKNMVYLSYPETTPTIISRRQLSLTDSFNRSLPPIPSPIPSPKKTKSANRFKFPGNKKRAVVAYTKRSKHQSYSPQNSPSNTRFQSPYHPPPEKISQLRISLAQPTPSSDDPLSSTSSTSDIVSCLSPRELTPSRQACAIPDFSDCEEDAITIRIPKPKDMKRPNTMKKDKKKVEKIRPIIASTKPQKEGYTAQKRTHSAKNIFKTKHSHSKSRNGRYITRVRSNSLGLSAKVQYNEYAVEVGDELVFINCKIQIGESELE